MYGLGLARHVIHEQVLSKRIRCGEVRLSSAHFRDLLHKLHQPVITRQHKSVNQNSCTFALGDFLQGVTHHQRIKSERVFLNAAIFEGQRRRFSVGDHDDLLHVFPLPLQNALRQPQPLSRIRVVRSHLNSGQL